jgi:hypothetical protein
MPLSITFQPIWFFSVSVLPSFNDGFLRTPDPALTSIFSQVDNGSPMLSPVSFALLSSYNRKEVIIRDIILPVQKTALGNSALFSLKYQDNYSAGDNVVFKNNHYWQTGTVYSDFWGNIEYLDVGFYPKMNEAVSSLEQQTAIGNALPALSSEAKPVNPSCSGLYIRIKKGSTEIPTIDYQVDFVTNRSNIIIGSALAKNFPLVSGLLGKEHKAKLYLFSNKRINKFEKIVDVTDGKEFDFNISLNINVSQFEIADTVTLNKQYKSWAIVDGATNELLVGCNKTINTADEIFNGLKMFITHDIFKDKN